MDRVASIKDIGQKDRQMIMIGQKRIKKKNLGLKG
jgi:hypothetical protein